VEEARKGVAEIEAAPAAVADLEHAREFRVDLFAVVEVGVFPLDAVPDRRFEAAFAHGRFPRRACAASSTKGAVDAAPFRLVRRWPAISRACRAPSGSARRATSRPSRASRTSRRSRRSLPGGR